MKKLILVLNIYFLSFHTLITEPPATYIYAVFVTIIGLAFLGPGPVENKVVWSVRCCAELYSFTLLTLALVSHIFTLQRVEIPIIWYVSCFLTLKLHCPFWTVNDCNWAGYHW